MTTPEFSDFWLGLAIAHVIMLWSAWQLTTEYREKAARRDREKRNERELAAYEHLWAAEDELSAKQQSRLQSRLNFIAKLSRDDETKNDPRKYAREYDQVADALAEIEMRETVDLLARQVIRERLR